MIADLRGGFVLVVSLLFLLIIIVVFALSTVMRPGRWSERPRSAS